MAIIILGALPFFLQSIHSGHTVAYCFLGSAILSLLAYLRVFRQNSSANEMFISWKMAEQSTPSGECSPVCSCPHPQPSFQDFYLGKKAVDVDTNRQVSTRYSELTVLPFSSCKGQSRLYNVMDRLIT